ncbi:3-oxoacyl-ACP reductase FabG1 [Amycolatopsis echigonensis]|uniref:SDR family NAD(P)-dependent oxidoreductase n=1 Tax=Amycolatopsis echigonensis TaxID=2576905 RepID=UPI001FE53816|nr:SDR family oxidoreductase [Amycolatopsis echigonensis]
MEEGNPGVALVTGGTGGVGSAVVARLTSDGFRVVTGGRNAEPSCSGQVVSRRIDVCDSSSVDAAVEAACELGPLTAVVVCHAVVFTTPLETMAEDALLSTLDVNLAGTARVCRAAASQIADGGAIVTMSSVAGARGRGPNRVAYGASKAGIEALTRYYAVALAARSVRVNTVVPGPLDHAMASTVGELRAFGDAEATITARIPLGRRLSVREVADTVGFLVSPRASGITGVALPVDGGLLAK